MSDVGCKCSCHCTTNEPTSNQNDTVSEKVVLKNPVYSSSAKVEDILNGMNLNPKLLQGIKENDCEHVVASIDPAILKYESGNHVVVPIDRRTIISLCVAVLQHIDCSIKRCQAIIMSTKRELSQVNEIMSKLGRHVVPDAKPHALYATIFRFLKDYKSDLPTPLILTGTSDDILLLITRTNINLNGIKIVACHAGPSTLIFQSASAKGQSCFNPEVWKYVPQDARIFTSSDYLMEAIERTFARINGDCSLPDNKKMRKRRTKLTKNKDKFLNETNPASEIVRSDPAVMLHFDPWRRQLHSITNDQIPTNSNQDKSSNAMLNPENNEREQKRKFFKFEKETVSDADTSDAESAESSERKKIKMEEGVVIDTNNTSSIESQDSEKIKE